VLLTVYTSRDDRHLRPLRADFDPRGMPALLLARCWARARCVWVLAALREHAYAIDRLVCSPSSPSSGSASIPRAAGSPLALGAGVAAGLLGAAVGTPDRPVRVVHGVAGLVAAHHQGESPGVLSREPGGDHDRLLVAGLLTPSLALRGRIPRAGHARVLVGMALFARVDQARFRRIVFAILFASACCSSSAASVLSLRAPGRSHGKDPS